MQVGGIEASRGLNNAAILANQSSLEIFRQLRLIEPKNSEWQESEIWALHQKADIMLNENRRDDSRAALEAAGKSLEILAASDRKNATWNIDLRSAIELQRAKYQKAEGQLAAAFQNAQAAISRLRGSGNAGASDNDITLSQAHLLAGDILSRLGRASEASTSWKAALASSLRPRRLRAK